MIVVSYFNLNGALLMRAFETEDEATTFIAEKCQGPFYGFAVSLRDGVKAGPIHAH